MNEDESSMVITLMVMKAPKYCIRSYRHFDTAHTCTFSRVLLNRFEVLSLEVCIVTAMAGKWQLVRGNKRGRITRWPCTVCNEGCTTNAIFCENCGQWAHYSCKDLRESEFQELSDITCAYICSGCRVDQKGKFDFKKSLQRLTEASCTRGIKSL